MRSSGRHSFVSIVSDSGVPIERIADLVGHAGGSRVTESVYRQQVKPVLVEGESVMDEIFGTANRRRVARKAKRPATWERQMALGKTAQEINWEAMPDHGVKRTLHEAVRYSEHGPRRMTRTTSTSMPLAIT